MLYASSRLSLVKNLGSSLFTDSIFATSKTDLTPDAYAAHLRHVAAPDPLSSREQELVDLRAAENAAASYEGSQARRTHVGTSPGFRWTQDAEDAVVDLARRQEDFLLILVSFFSLFPFQNVCAHHTALC
jgi:twinfilin-like protein